MDNPGKTQPQIEQYSLWKDPKGNTWLALYRWRTGGFGPYTHLEMIWLESRTNHIFKYAEVENAIKTGQFQAVEKLTVSNPS